MPKLESIANDVKVFLLNTPYKRKVKQIFWMGN